MLIETVFKKLPDVFLETYKAEILSWAMEREGNTKAIRLLRKPGVNTVLDISHIQETVSLLRESYRHPVSGEWKVLVGPASNFDVEIIELHCQMLPKIIAARATAAREWAQSGQQVDARFDRVPDAFLKHYDTQFKTWGREFKKRGQNCAVILDYPPGTVPPLDDGGRPVIAAVWFKAHLDWADASKPKLVIEPKDEFAEELIARHTREMKRYWD